MIDYLHVKSPENIIATEEPLYFFERRLTKYEAVPDQPPIPGQYVIFSRKQCYYTLQAWQADLQFVVPNDLLYSVRTINGEMWRNQHNALRTHPNEQRYWQELLHQILTHPSKYPMLTNEDKLLFALTWHGAHLFWADPRHTHGCSAAFARGFRHEPTEPVPKKTVYPRPGVTYTRAHYQDLWAKTWPAARSGSACAPYTPYLPQG